MFLLQVVLIALIIITIMLLLAVIVAGVYLWWMMLVLPFLMIARDVLRWVYHRWFVPSPSHYKELRREMYYR